MQYQMKQTYNRNEKEAHKYISLVNHFRELKMAADSVWSEIDARQAYLASMIKTQLHTAGMVLRVETKQKFNLQKFKKQHPDMYANFCDEVPKIKVEEDHG